MKIRIAVWAVTGALIVALWSAYLMTTHSALHGPMLTFVCLTCPIALAHQHPMSVYLVLVVNAATYAMAGLALESIWRYFTKPRPVSH